MKKCKCGYITGNQKLKYCDRCGAAEWREATSEEEETHNEEEAHNNVFALRKWFALALPGAWLISWLILIFRGFAPAFSIVFPGICFFPIGLISLFVWNVSILRDHIFLFVVFGYTAYAALIIWGLIRPYKLVLLVLCLLLLANIAGCQLERTYAAII
jgi:hypothetical protein